MSLEPLPDERNASVALRSYLVAQAQLTALVGQRVYAETDTPPAGYTPADGAAICFKVRGGNDDYSDALQNVSFQFKCYGTGGSANAQVVSARAVSRALHAVLQNAGNPAIRGARREALPTVLAESDTGWPFALTFYRVMIANEEL